MEITVITDQLTRLPAIVAGIAVVIALSLALRAIMRARRARLARAKAEREARRLVGLMRKCPRLSKSDDRKLALRFAQELDAVVTANGFALHEVGTSRQEIDRILFLIREDAVANPRYDQPNALRRTLNREEPGTPGIAINDAASEDDDAKGEEEVLLTVTFAVSELGAVADSASEEDHVDIIDPEILPAPEPSDPIKALQTLNDDELDAFVIERFDAMTIKD